MYTNLFEHAIVLLVRKMTKQQLTKLVPAIPSIDYRRLTFCLIQDRIAAYKAAGQKRTLQDVLTEFGITTTAYYAWYEKYHSSYQAMYKNSAITSYKM